MYITPIDDTTVDGVLPERVERSRGLFAWGLPRLGSRRLILAFFELIVVFIGLPAAAFVFGGALVLPVVMAVMVTSTAILLSATKSFHWADLAPIDFWSEWRLLLGGALGFAAIAAAATALFAPDRLLTPAPETLIMLIGFPIVTALPLELVYRVLLLRRYGHLFRSEPLAIIFGGAATALVYLVLSNSLSGAVFGGLIGLALGWTYLRTGSFLLVVALHWAAAAALFLIGPGLI